MGTQEDNVVRVALLGLRNDVPGLSRFENRVDKKGGLEIFTSLEALSPGRAVLESNDTDGNNVKDVLSTESRAADILAWVLVHQNDASGTGDLGELELVRDGAGASLDEDELVLGIEAFPLVLEAARASLIIDRNGHEGSSDTIRGGSGGVVLESDDIDILAIRSSDPDIPCLLKGVVEGLDKGVEVFAVLALDLVQDIIQRGLVAGETERSVTAVLVGDFVEVLEGSTKSGGG